MTKIMSLSARLELAAALSARYQTANCKDKIRILDEFIATTCYHRKAGHLSSQTLTESQPILENSHRSRSRTYTPDVKDALITVWQVANRICSKRLAPFMTEFVSSLERHGHLSLCDSIRNKLLRVSPATIDRLLRDVRHAGRKSGLVTTRPGSLLEHQVPIRTFPAAMV